VHKPEKDAEKDRGRFSFAARPVAIWSVALSFACLAALAVVVGTTGKDALSSTALALAIFAFALQIVFFVVQLRVASDQDRRNVDLFRETSAVLTKIDERSAATVEVIREQFGFVLRHALGSPLDNGPIDDEGTSDGASLDDGAEPGLEFKPVSQEDLDAAVARGLRALMQPELLGRWQEISRLPQEQDAGQARRRAREFEAEVGRVLKIATVARPEMKLTVRPRAPTGVEADFLIDEGGTRGLVEVKAWDSVPASVVAHTRVHVAGLKDVFKADEVVVVSRRPLEERARQHLAPFSVVTLDGLADLLAQGWPRPTSSSGDS
jgi:hypothetical protein